MTRDEVIKYLKGVDDKEKRKPLLFSFLQNLFFKDKQTDFILKLYKKDHVNLFGVPLNSQYHFFSHRLQPKLICHPSSIACHSL